MPSRTSTDPALMALRGRIGGHMTNATHDPVANTEKARAAFRQSFETLADPEGTLSPAERTRRAEKLRQVHFARLAYLSAVARRGRAIRKGTR